MSEKSGRFSNGFASTPRNHSSMKTSPAPFISGKTHQVSSNGAHAVHSATNAKSDGATLKIAKASKKLNKAPVARPPIEIYRPPVLRRDLTSTKSSEDLSTRPQSVAGLKQLSSNNGNDFKRSSIEHLRNSGVMSDSFHDGQLPSQHQQSKMHYKSRTFSHNKSTENLRYPNQHHHNTQKSHGYRDGFNDAQKRSATPPAQISESKCERATTSIPSTNIKRSGSFVKDLPKKKTFGSKEAQEARLLFDALGIANDDTIKEWLSGISQMHIFIQGNFESTELSTPVGQLLVQMAIEQSKSPKTVGKLAALLIDCSSGEHFHKGLVTGCSQYYECRIKLKSEHFRFWLSFINCLTELYSNLGFTYDGELVQILLLVYNYLLEPSILEDIKIEELECLISSLLSVGYNLERQYPDKLSEFLGALRNSFIRANEPWVRKSSSFHFLILNGQHLKNFNGCSNHFKMLLLMIELCASSWKLPSEANDYYFQAHYSTS